MSGNSDAAAKGLTALASPEMLKAFEERQQRDLDAIEAFRTASAQIKPLAGPEEWDRPMARMVFDAVLPLVSALLDEVSVHDDMEIVVRHVWSKVVSDMGTHLHELDAGRSDRRLRPLAGGASRAHSDSLYEWKRFALSSVRLVAEQQRVMGKRNHKAAARNLVADALRQENFLIDGRLVTAKRLESWEKRRNDRR